MMRADPGQAWSLARAAGALPAPRWPLTLLLSFVVALGWWVLTGLPDHDALLMGLGNDPTMRLISVRDLLDGQGWFDPVQARLGPDGLAMHWSRLVDGPMAAFVALVEPFAGRAAAETALLILWPVLMLAVVSTLSVGIATRLNGPLAGWLAGIATLAAFHQNWRFPLGDLDHHSIQLALMLGALLGLLARHDGARPAVLAGLCVAASLSIGVETLPMLALLGVATALLWVLRGGAERGPAIGFGLGLGVGLPVLFAATAPRIAWAGGFCDALSRDLAVPVTLGALALTGAAATLSGRTRPVRLGAMAVAGGAVGAVVLLWMPACLSNPYDALDPFLHANWLVHVTEAWGLFGMPDGPQALTMRSVLVAATLGAALMLLRRDEGGLLVALLLAIAAAMTVYQVRGASHLAPLAVIAVVAPLAGLMSRAVAAPRPEIGLSPLLASATALVGTALLTAFVGGYVAHAVILQARALDAPNAAEPAAAVVEGLGACRRPSALRALDALPPALVAVHWDAGTAVMRETHHAVLAAPYHRGETGLAAQIRIWQAEDDAEAERIARAVGLDYLVLCPRDVARIEGAEEPTVGVIARLVGGTTPAFLSPVELLGNSALRVWRVLPPQ